MKQLTIRDIPDDIAKTIKKEAKEKHLSLNKAFISILEKATGIKAKKMVQKTTYHDLDHFCGAWTKNDAEIFEKSLEIQRKIDEDLWKKTG